MKTRTLCVVLAASVLAAGCGGGDDQLQRGEQQYDVVQEGAGGAVTSTIHAPGEVMPPLTQTNADTTTSFTLPMSGTDPTMMTDTAPRGSLADTLQTETAYSPPPRRSTPAPAPQPAPTPQPTTTFEPRPTDPQPQPAPAPPPTETREQEPEPEPERDPEPQPQPQPQPQPPPPTPPSESEP